MNAPRTRNEDRLNRGKEGRNSLSGSSLRLPGASPAAIRAARGIETYQCIHQAMNTRTGSRSQAQVFHFNAVTLKARSGNGASAAGEGIFPEP